MGSWSCAAWSVVGYLLQGFRICLLLYALVSWVPSLRGKWSDFIGRIVEPVLAPIRRVIPPLGGLDIAFLVVLIGLSYAVNAVAQIQYQSYCFFR